MNSLNFVCLAHFLLVIIIKKLPILGHISMDTLYTKCGTVLGITVCRWHPGILFLYEKAIGLLRSALDSIVNLRLKIGLKPNPLCINLLESILIYYLWPLVTYKYEIIESSCLQGFSFKYYIKISPVTDIPPHLCCSYVYCICIFFPNIKGVCQKIHDEVHCIEIRNWIKIRK